MTTTDQQMLDALGYLQLAHPWCPTLTELATAVGLSNRSSTVPRLARLRDAGLVDWRPGEPRTLHLTWEGWDASTHDGPPDTARAELELAHCRAMLDDCATQLRDAHAGRSAMVQLWHDSHLHDGPPDTCPAVVCSTAGLPSRPSPPDHPPCQPPCPDCTI